MEPACDVASMSQVGSYTIFKRLGSGQFGSAYMVKHSVTGRASCMKQISVTAEVTSVSYVIHRNPHLKVEYVRYSER